MATPERAPQEDSPYTSPSEFDFSALTEDPLKYAHSILLQAAERMNCLGARDPHFLEALGLDTDQIAQLVPLDDRADQVLPHIPLSVGVSDEGILLLTEMLGSSEDPTSQDVARYLLTSANQLQTLASVTEITPESDLPEEDDTGRTSGWTVGNVDMQAIAEAIAFEIDPEMAPDGLMGIGQVLAVAHILRYTIPVSFVLEQEDLGYVNNQGHTYISACQFAAVVARWKSSKNGGISREKRKFTQSFVRSFSLNGSSKT